MRRSDEQPGYRRALTVIDASPTGPRQLRAADNQHPPHHHPLQPLGEPQPRQSSSHRAPPAVAAQSRDRFVPRRADSARHLLMWPERLWPLSSVSLRTGSSTTPRCEHPSPGAFGLPRARGSAERIGALAVAVALLELAVPDDPGDRLAVEVVVGREADEGVSQRVASELMWVDAGLCCAALGDDTRRPQRQRVAELARLLVDVVDHVAKDRALAKSWASSTSSQSCSAAAAGRFMREQRAEASAIAGVEQRLDELLRRFDAIERHRD